MSTQPLTPAELAAAEVLAARHNASDATHSYSVAAFHGDGRAVVAAVQPYLIAQFCEEAADAVDQLGPIDGNHLRIMAHQSLSRPTSEEH